MKRIAFIILVFNIVLSYELTTFSEMTFPLGMNSDGTIIVGSNLNNQAVIWTASDGTTIVGDGEFWGVSEDGKIAGSLTNSAGKEEAVIWENGIITYLGNVPGGNSCDAFYSLCLGTISIQLTQADYIITCIPIKCFNTAIFPSHTNNRCTI